MGIYQSLPLTVLKPHQWKPLSYNNLYYIVECKQLNLLGQLYELRIDNFEQQAIIYQYRHDYPEYLVTVSELRVKGEQYICPGSYCIEVITERIPHRLADLGQLQALQAYEMILSVLKGCEIFYKQYGGVLVDQNMICFNTEGRCKVWLNENIAVNTLLSETVITKDEQELVSNIFNLFQKRIDTKDCIQLRFDKDWPKYRLNNIQKAIYFVNLRIRRLKTVNMNKKQLKQSIMEKQLQKQLQFIVSDYTEELSQSKKTVEMIEKIKTSRKYSLKKNKIRFLQDKPLVSSRINKMNKVHSQQMFQIDQNKNYYGKVQLSPTLKSSNVPQKKPQQFSYSYKQKIQFPLVRKGNSIKSVDSLNKFFPKKKKQQIDSPSRSQLHKTSKQTYIPLNFECTLQCYKVCHNKYN